MSDSDNPSKGFETEPYQTDFTLTRDYLAESYDESLPHADNSRTGFAFPGILLMVGAALLIFTDQPEYGGWALVALGVVELMHIRFRRGWWLFRQTWGKNHELTVTLTIDQRGVETTSSLTTTTVPWSDITQVIETERGVILVTADGQQYLSKSVIGGDWLGVILGIEGSKETAE